MAFTSYDGTRIYWRLDGLPDRPVLLLLNSLGTDLSMWDPVVPSLTEHYRLLRLDTRGHGASDVPAGDYALAQLGADVLAVMDAAGVAKAVAVCGLSLGGMVAQWLALHAPDRFGALVACNTSASLPAEPWRQRAALVREKGVGAIADAVMERFFSADFRSSGSPLLATARSVLAATDPGGYAGCCAAISEVASDLGEAVSRIRLPTLVVNGAQDAATPAEHGDAIARLVPGARMVTLQTGHISVLEAPDAFAGAVGEFIETVHSPSLEGARATLFEQGLGPRRTVLGRPWVDKALSQRNAFSGEFQEFITRYAWGEIWGRPGLDHRTRRLLVLATTIALGRWEEFRLHVRAGLEQDGFSLEDLREVIMQSGIYAGVPAANTGFHHAEDVLKSLGRLP